MKYPENKTSETNNNNGFIPNPNPFLEPETDFPACINIYSAVNFTVQKLVFQ
jgi:hypothetical protein